MVPFFTGFLDSFYFAVCCILYPPIVFPVFAPTRWVVVPCSYQAHRPQQATAISHLIGRTFALLCRSMMNGIEEDCFDHRRRGGDQQTPGLRDLGGGVRHISTLKGTRVVGAWDLYRTLLMDTTRP